MIAIYRVVLLIFTLFVFTVQADNSVSYQSGRLYISDDDGLVVNIPAQETLDVLSQLQKLRSELNVNKKHFAEDVENTRFKTGDVILSVIMPGGLLYAAHKKQKHAQAMEEMKLVTVQLDGFAGDAVFLKSTYSKAVLASRESLCVPNFC